MLDAERVRVAEERVRKGFSRKECPELSREREVSQVKKGDREEVKQKAPEEETGKTGRAFICHMQELGLDCISKF